MSDRSPANEIQSLNHLSNDQSIDQPDQITQLGFVENVDFIKLADSESESHPNKSKRKHSSTNTPNKSTGARGTKRKFDASAITEEQTDAVRKKKGSVITPWFDKISWKRRSVQQMLTYEIGSFVAYIQPTEEEHKLREMLVEMIRKLVRARWPDADVEPFGSFGSKLYLPLGDIDLVILSTQMMSQAKSKILYRLAPLIRENNVGHDVTVIAKAKVPIIKFKTIHGNIKVDISINQTNGIVGLRKVNELLQDIKLKSKHTHSSNRHHKHHGGSHSHRERDSHRPPSSFLDPFTRDEESISRTVEELGAAKCLILVIKSVLKQRGMNEVYTGGLGSYSIICLVVSFLQLHPKIQRGDIDPNKNLGVLLLEFFELYGKHFNFDQTGISVRKGGYYFSKAHRGWQRERQPYLLSIEDPADESHDISSNSHNILSVRTVFSGAFDLLSATLYHRHSLQSSRSGALDKFSSPRPLLSVPVPKQESSAAEGRKVIKDPMDESLLGEIMGVTKELVEHRKKNIKLFYSGTLQRLLQLPPPRPIGSSEKLSKGKTSLLNRQDRRSELSSSSTRVEGSRRDNNSTRTHEHPVEADVQVKKRRQEDELEGDRKHLTAKDCNSQASGKDGHSMSLQSRRELVRYDDSEIFSPSESKINGSEKKKKRKNGKNDNKSTPQKLWVEDLEPTEVPILKNNQFALDIQNHSKSKVERIYDDQVDVVNHQDLVIQTDQSSPGRDVDLDLGIQDKKRKSDGEDASQSNSEVESLAEKIQLNDEHDEQIDSRYRTFDDSRSNKSNQLTLNFETHGNLFSSSSGTSSASNIFRQLTGNQHTYVEDDDDSESDTSESPHGHRSGEVKDKNNCTNDKLILNNNTLPTLNELSAGSNYLKEEVPSNNTCNMNKIQNEVKLQEKEEGELSPVTQDTQECLPGNLANSPLSRVKKIDEKERNLGLEIENGQVNESCLNILPATPPSSP